jgi:histidine racemase
MKLNFIKANPTENMTVFISDPLPRSIYSSVANKLMNYNSLCAEQVGFIEKPTMDGSHSRLHMMGGEFCGNASRAFAALLVHKDPGAFDRNDGKYTVPIEISGSDEVLNAVVKQVEDQVFEVNIKLPLFKSAGPFSTHYKGAHYQGALVEFEGISHVILFSGDDVPDEGLLRHIVKDEEHSMVDAFGVMFYNEKNNFMTPLVYVADTDSVVWERSCGTGTAALGVALSMSSQSSVDMHVNQPGGRLEIITTMKKGVVVDIHLAGEVSIVAEGQVYVAFDPRDGEE